MTRSSAAILIATLLSAACSSNEKQRAAQEIASWQATVELVQKERRVGTIPDVYAQQALAKASKEIAKARKKAQ